MTHAIAQKASDRPVLAYYGHHKCASSWIAGIMARLMEEIGLRYCGVYDTLAPAGPGSLTIEWLPTTPFDRAELREQIDARGAEFVTVGAADQAQAKILKPVRAFHVIRDPRDLIVSAYFSHRNSHTTVDRPHLKAHREALRRLSLHDGLLLEMEFSGAELHRIGDWDYTDESVLELRMEDLIREQYDGFIRIFRHLGLLADDEPLRAAEHLGVWSKRLLNRLSHRRPLGRLRRKIPATGEMILGAVFAERFEAQTKGRERGAGDTGSHYRKGIAGDWVNHFTPRHASVFEELYGDILVRLGYEEDSDWAAVLDERD
jgi:hypothetical protein